LRVVLAFEAYKGRAELEMGEGEVLFQLQRLLELWNGFAETAHLVVGLPKRIIDVSVFRGHAHDLLELGGGFGISFGFHVQLPQGVRRQVVSWIDADRRFEFFFRLAVFVLGHIDIAQVDMY